MPRELKTLIRGDAAGSVRCRTSAYARAAAVATALATAKLLTQQSWGDQARHGHYGRFAPIAAEAVVRRGVIRNRTFTRNLMVTDSPNLLTAL